MASVYSDASWTGTYTYTRVRVDYSGSSATAHLLYTRTNTYSGATSCYNATFTFGGASTTYSATLYGQQTDVEIASLTFSISMSGGTYSGSADGYLMGGSWSVTIPSQITAPSVSFGGITARYTNGFKAKIMATSWGSGGSDSSKYIEIQVAAYNDTDMTPARWNTYFTTDNNWHEITVTNNSPYSQENFTIYPNTSYAIGTYGTNGAASIGRTFIGNDTTLAAITDGVISDITTNSATLTISVPEQGTARTITAYYRIKKETDTDWSDWVTVGTVSPNSSVSIEVSSLEPETTYVLTPNINNGLGGVNATNVTFTTPAEHKAYASLDGVAKKVSTIYAPVSEVAKKVAKVYASENGVTKRVY